MLAAGANCVELSLGELGGLSAAAVWLTVLGAPSMQMERRAAQDCASERKCFR